MTTSTTTRLVTIKATSCGECGVQFGLEANFMSAREKDGRSFYCPNGHYIGWAGQKTEEKLRTQLDAARSVAKRESERRVAAERQRSAARGQVTKIKNRVSKGVCPCCNRTFVDLARHMNGQHPEWSEATQ